MVRLSEGIGYAISWELVMLLIGNFLVLYASIYPKSSANLLLSETSIMVGIFCILFGAVQPVNRLCW